jgi:hypothetical protein
LIKNGNIELVLDHLTSRENFKDLLIEFPNYPQIPVISSNKMESN